MSSALTLSLVLALLCTGGVTAQRKLDSAPFNFSEASSLYQYSHHLSCRDDQIVSLGFVENGYKQNECQCDVDQQCCQSAHNDCLQAMSPDILQQVTLECWDKSQCRPLVTKPKDSCWKDGMEFQWPTRSAALYSCTPGDTVMNMTQQTSVSGAEVTVRALPAGLPHSHTVTCSVEAVGEGQQEVGVSSALVQGAPPLSCLSVGTETLSKESHDFALFTATTPFHLRLQQPAHSSLRYAWVLMEADDGEIRVSCGQVETTPSFTCAGGLATVPAVGLVAGLVGLAVVLTISWVFFFLWRRRQRARWAGQEAGPDQGGHIVLADLATPRPGGSDESLEKEGNYERLAVPGTAGAQADVVTTAGQQDYVVCDVAKVTAKNPTDVIKAEREGEGEEESPYDVIGPSDGKEDRK